MHSGAWQQVPPTEAGRNRREREAGCGATPHLEINIKSESSIVDRLGGHGDGAGAGVGEALGKAAASLAQEEGRQVWEVGHL